MLSTTSYLILALILFGPLFYKPLEENPLELPLSENEKQ
jgi:hypothetical protein